MQQVANGLRTSENFDSRKGAKHVLSGVEGGAKEKHIVISTEGRNLSQIPRIRSGSQALPVTLRAWRSFGFAQDRPWRDKRSKIRDRPLTCKSGS
jgi:hypothetical protein